MSDKEITRLEIMQKIKDRRMSQKEAAGQLGISIRQVKRLWKAFQSHGAIGLISQKRGKPSNHQLKPEQLQQALDLIKSRYQGFGPTLAHEKLVEVHRLKISDERVRQLMIAEGLWKPKRARRKRVYQMRERRACRGELVQIDGSDYAWFGNGGPRCTLLVFVDDATGELLQLLFVPHESFFGYCEATRRYIEREGKPLAFYSDKHGIFHLNHPTAVQGDGLTEFGRAMQELEIQILCANTPQAKGRVERANQTLQDRLAKELQLRDIGSLQEGNTFLPEFMADYNRRFAVSPRSSFDAHRPLSPTDDLERILTRQITRILSSSLSFQYNKRIYQIQTRRPGYAMRKAVVTVCEKANGEVLVLYKGHPLPYQVVQRQPHQAEVVTSKSVNQAVRQPTRPAPDHPWRKPFLKGSPSFDTHSDASQPSSS
ncbi:ISNCY family transposase [bacterium]|nr:MAG: ISNCY family transposase [bacterium]